ncbi:Transcriptional regulator, DeoR family [uncultured spirochete]|jgi:DeoR/GlpR family transcriptional regulator of sugar metabolism|uniref:Transcriptional regulator, DeoR family n=1 Tax=uncultured spirochete TaxID=156406 RepID=A0A3P3XR47_9SPIR|nr:Transcriptional regulator, DeoR family [uncultured spirochete]
MIISTIMGRVTDIKNYLRQQEIVRMLQTEQIIRVSELINRFSVTPATIRRDLSVLERAGKIQRTRGEARIVQSQSIVLPFFQRSELQTSEKIAIAKTARDLIADNQAIILDSGTTTLAIAQQLFNKKQLTVITNSIPISYVFANQDIEVRLSGGIVLPAHMALIGPDAEAYFRGIQVDICFIGASGVRSGSGFTTSSPFECSIKQQMMRAARQVVAVVDSSKFSISRIIEFARFEEINKLITTYPINDKESLSRLEKLGVEIIYAQV